MLSGHDGLKKAENFICASDCHCASLFGIPEHKDDRVSSDEEFGNKSVFVDRRRALLSLACLWNLRRCRQATLRLRQQNLSGAINIKRYCSSTNGVEKGHTSVHISFTFSRIMLQCLSKAFTLPSSLRLFLKLMRTCRHHVRSGLIMRTNFTLSHPGMLQYGNSAMHGLAAFGTLHLQDDLNQLEEQ